MQGLGPFAREMRGKARPNPLETGLAAKRAESGFIGDIGQVGAIAVGPAPPHCALEHRQRLIGPALNRRDRSNVGIEREGNRSLTIEGTDPGGRLAEQPIGVCRAACLFQGQRDHGRFVQLIRAHRFVGVKAEQPNRAVVRRGEFLRAAGLEHQLGGHVIIVAINVGRCRIAIAHLPG